MIRALLGVILALSLTAVEAQAGPFFKFQRVAATSTRVTNVNILPTGWQAEVSVAGSNCGSGAYSLTPDATPKMVLTVTSPGNDTSGNATTRTRSVVGTIPLRQPGTGAPANRDANYAGNCKVTVALSDFINVGDTATASFLSGFYTSTGPSITSAAASNVPVANWSSYAHQPPICHWVSPAHQRIDPAAAFSLEVFCYHERPMNLGQVAAVDFTLSDASTVTHCITTGMVQSSIIITGNPSYVYRCTFGANTLAFSNASCAAGASCEITADFTAKPWIGNVNVSASGGQDGVAIPASTVTPNLHPLLQIFDQHANAYSPAYAWVCAAGSGGCTTGTCSTIGCIHSDQTDPGTGVTLNFPTVFAAANTCKTYNNTSGSVGSGRSQVHNDTAACVVMPRANSAINGWNTSGGTELQTLATGIGWLKVIPAPGETPSTVAMSRSSTSTGTNKISNRMWVEIGIRDTTTNGNQVVGADTTSATPSTEYVCNGCAHTTGAAAAQVTQVGLAQYYNAVVDETLGSGNFTSPPGAAPRNAYQVFGGVWTCKPDSSIGFIPSTVIGAQGTGLCEIINVPTGANTLIPTGVVIAYTSFKASWVPYDINNASLNANFPVAHWAELQNLWEKIGADTSPNHRFLGDLDVQPFGHFSVQYSGFYGARDNSCYDNKTLVDPLKICTYLYSVYGKNANGNFNAKGDQFAPVENRVGNWTIRFGVGSCGRVMFNDSNGNTAPGYQAWMGDYLGCTGSNGATDPNNFGYNQTLGFVSDLSADTTQAVINGTISGTTLTVNSVTSGAVAVGQTLGSAALILPGVFVASGSGTTWTLSKSVAGVTAQTITLGPAGGGDYHLSGTCSASPAYKRVPAGMAGLPFDLGGTARRNDGTGAAGPYEC